MLKMLNYWWQFESWSIIDLNLLNILKICWYCGDVETYPIWGPDNAGEFISHSGFDSLWMRGDPQLCSLMQTKTFVYFICKFLSSKNPPTLSGSRFWLMAVTYILISKCVAFQKFAKWSSSEGSVRNTIFSHAFNPSFICCHCLGAVNWDISWSHLSNSTATHLHREPIISLLSF